MERMSTTTLFRLSGLALLVALPIQLVGWILHPSGERLVDLLSPTQGPAHVVMFFSWFCVMLGLPGLYAWQAERAGRLGLLGFLAAMYSLAYGIYVMLYEAFPAVLLAQDPNTAQSIAMGGPLAHGAGAFGSQAFATLVAYPLFGLATLRAGVLPRLVGWLHILCVPAFFVSIIGLSVLLGDALDNLPGPLQPIALLYYMLFVAYARGGYALWSGERAHVVSATRTPMQQVAA